MRGDGVVFGVCALCVVLGVVAHGVKVARIVGDGVSVGVRPVCHSVFWLLMVWGCTDRGECVAVGVSCLLVTKKLPRL